MHCLDLRLCHEPFKPARNRGGAGDLYEERSKAEAIRLCELSLLIVVSVWTCMPNEWRGESNAAGGDGMDRTQGTMVCQQDSKKGSRRRVDCSEWWTLVWRAPRQCLGADGLSNAHVDVMAQRLRGPDRVVQKKNRHELHRRQTKIAAGSRRSETRVRRGRNRRSGSSRTSARDTPVSIPFAKTLIALTSRQLNVEQLPNDTSLRSCQIP